MFNAICFKVNVLSACSHLNLPPFFMPSLANFTKTFNYLNSLSMIRLCILHILFCKKLCFFNKIILNLSVCFYIHETEYKFICVPFQFVSYVPDARQKVARSNVWCNDERVKGPNNSLLS